MTRKLASHEVVTIAVFLLGGEREPVDTEDAAKKANELAPGRFTWRKNKDQIDLEIVRGYLSDATKKTKGAYLIGTGSSGWTLSEAGLAFARANVGGVEVLDTRISPGDGMFCGNLEHYLRVGESAVRCIKVALAAAQKDRVDSILDLPCGHGRVLRTLATAFPEASLTACDLSTDGVDFCAETFGATPVYSREDPRELALGKFDLVWSGSLLTHLDAGRWEGFLDLFNFALDDGGVLVFTTHGRRVVERMRRGMTYGLPSQVVSSLIDDWERTGFAFRSYTPDVAYGISLSSPSWVCKLIAAHLGLRLVTYTEAAWDDHQDVVACVHPAS